MPSTSSNDEPDLDTASETPVRRSYRWLVVIFCLLVVFLLLTFVPPLINAARFQLRIAQNISASVGRPVHFDRVSPVLLPLPGFTLENFVVDEDPAFGSEPILRADEVRATLRLTSLFGHAEFSKISLTDPSVNLVRAPNGHWNIEGILLQASHIQAAPTGQRFAGSTRRFPYIEATGARLNLKLGDEKTPFSLTDTDFALSLPEPHQWHLRLEAHPVRTDSAPGDTGTVRLEGTLGAADHNAGSLADIPIDLHGDWRDAQLGGLTRLVFGSDSGLRGDFTINFTVRGTVGQNAIATDIKLAKARRADFVPAQPLSLDAACNADARNSFQSFTSIECHWPPADQSERSLLILTADLPDVGRPSTATINITVPALPASTFFDWLHIATPHAPTGAGNLSGTVAYGPPAQPAATSGAPQSTWTGELEFAMATIELDSAAHNSIDLGDVTLHSPPSPTASTRHVHAAPPTAPPLDSFDLEPISLDLGGKQPATLEGHVDSTGYTLHLAGTVIGAKLLELGNAVPQFGEGLQDCVDKIAKANESAKSGSGTDDTLITVPIHVDISSTRTWGNPQVWTQTATPAPAHPKHWK